MKTKYLFSLLILVTALRAAWVLTHEVVPAEAYYWACSHRLAAGYFDGPAGTAFLVRAFGENFELARLFWPVLGFFCSCTAWLFVRRIYDAAVAGWCVVFLNLLPVFNTASVVAGPLMPAMVSVLAGLVFARVAWEGAKWAWLGAGVFFGIALLFRYEAILVPAGVVAAALFSDRHRTSADIFGLLAIAICGFFALLPALLWNAALEWIPVAGGTWKTAWEFRPVPFWESLESFAMAFSVPVFTAVVIALWFLIRNARRHGRAVFILAACAPAWVWTFYILLRGGDAVPAGLFGIVPLAAFAFSSARKNPLAPAIGGFVAVVALLASGYSLWVCGQVSWKSVANYVRDSARDLPPSEGGGFFIAEDANLAAVLGYYLPGEGSYPPVFVPESPDLSSQFGLWPSYADFVESDRAADEYFQEQKGVNPFIGRNAIFLGRDLPQTIKGAFQDVQPLRKITTPDGREFTIFTCLGYQTLPL
jgi:Dolichyl-phosphate-mannose-protein mannosyltransferase